MTLTADLASFEFDGRPPWKGTPVVNGHPVRTAQSIDVHMDPESVPVVTMRLLVADVLKLDLDDTAVIALDDGTRAALVSLGWTPPPEPGRG